jgi:Tol biopolymer transport system component
MPVLKFLTLFILAAGGAAPGVAGERPLTLTGPYLGQKPPGLVAEKFAPGLVSSSAFEHSRLEISQDGNEFFWIVQPERGRQQIWTTRRNAGGAWSRPAPLQIANGVEALPFLSSPALSADGRALYFYSCDLDPWRVTLYAVDLRQPRWDSPVPVRPWFPEIDKVWVYSFAANGNLYFDCGFKLFAMARSGAGYGPPARLSDEIDSHGPFTPFVASDESYIIFSGEGSRPADGLDLYIAFRRADGGWSAPQNLGPGVNTAMNERFPTVSPDGRYLFFLRNPPDGDADFFWVDSAVIARAKCRAHPPAGKPCP